MLGAIEAGESAVLLLDERDKKSAFGGDGMIFRTHHVALKQFTIAGLCYNPSIFVSFIILVRPSRSVVYV